MTSPAALRATPVPHSRVHAVTSWPAAAVVFENLPDVRFVLYYSMRAIAGGLYHCGCGLCSEVRNG